MIKISEKMNLEEVIKECEQLQTTIEKPSQKGFPHIVSKDSFERMIAEDHLHRIDVETPPPSCPMKVNIMPKVQQTSVIIANNGRKTSRKLSMQRQARFDDSADALTDSDCSNEKSFVSDSDSPKLMFKNFINRPATFDAGHVLEKSRSFDTSRSHSSEGHYDSYGSIGYESGEQLSRLATKGANYPLGRLSKQSNQSFDSDDQASYYMNSLHISPTQHQYYQDNYCSLHSSSRESLLESPTNSIRNSSRRLHDPQYDNAHERTSPVIPPQSPSVRSTTCRSYESQQHRQYKYCQRRALSLNTAPYHQLNSEQNLRRILSEEIVAENPLIDCIRRANLPNSKLRRAASYDTFDDMGRDSHIPNYPLESERQLPPQLSNQTQAPTKIMFPEHVNTKEHSIFTPKTEDENLHLLNVHRMIEKSVFGPELELNYRQNHLSNFNPNLEKEIKNENQSQAKTKATKCQNDNNHTIGPYEYDPTKDDEVAVCVSGLLNLPGSNEKRYPITVGELRRRIAPPEYLNKVDMISYVRLAKTSARELLEKYEIRPKHHSRKSKHSVISKMCEAECAELASGLNSLSGTHFPEKWLAKLSISSEEESTDKDEFTRVLTEQISRVEIARSVLQEFLVVLENNKSASEMQDYNLATHSYGFLDLSNNIKLLTSFLECQQEIISNKINSLDPSSSASIRTAPMDTDIEAALGTKVEDDSK